MPTPDWVRQAAKKRRERKCPICGVQFLASRPTAKGLCSPQCQAINYSLATKGKRKHSPETKAKMSKSAKLWRITQPDWEVRRCAAVNAATQTDEYRQGALDRYLRMVENETGICSQWTKDYTAACNKWVMKKAKEALANETDFSELWRTVQHRLRLEMPYTGDQDSADYFEYSQKLGRALTLDPEISGFHNAFMRDAIPRFYKEWADLKNEGLL